MTDYGHELVFGTFITPQNQRPQDVGPTGPADRTGRPGPGHLHGSPLSAGVPGHLDAAVVRGCSHRAGAAVRVRAEPAVPSPGGAGPGGGQPGPAVLRPGRAGPRPGGYLRG